MAKVSELSDKDLDEMIEKHEKTLQLLIKEKERRTGKSSSVKVTLKSSDSYQLVIDEEILKKAQEAQPIVSNEGDEETANMRLTRVLKLSKAELEQFNKAVENRAKKIKIKK